MKRWNVILAAFLSLGLLAAQCEKEDTQLLPEDEYSEFIFGVAYGFCGGNCVHLFKMTDGNIYPDLMDKGNPEEATFSSVPLNDQKYQLAVPIREQFPEALFDEKETIGCPDCADQGGYYIQLTRDGEVFKWRIDTQTKSLPDFLQDYAEKMGGVIEDLK